MMKYRTDAQLAEILGDDNRWYCSQYYRREINDPETLARYFCRHGGAINFALRWCEAMSETNRYYCGQHYRRQITDERTLWEYYMSQLAAASDDGGDQRELSVA